MFINYRESKKLYDGFYDLLNAAMLVADKENRIRLNELFPQLGLGRYSVPEGLEGDSFETLIMAAMRRADTDNLEKLKELSFGSWLELSTRYHAPGGCLSVKEAELHIERLDSEEFAFWLGRFKENHRTENGQTVTVNLEQLREMGRIE